MRRSHILDKHQERSSSFDPTAAYPKHSSEIKPPRWFFLPFSLCRRSYRYPLSLRERQGLAMTISASRAFSPISLRFLERDQARARRADPAVCWTIRFGKSRARDRRRGRFSLTSSERLAGGVHFPLASPTEGRGRDQHGLRCPSSLARFPFGSDLLDGPALLSLLGNVRSGPV